MRNTLFGPILEPKKGIFGAFGGYFGRVGGILAGEGEKWPKMAILGGKGWFLEGFGWFWVVLGGFWGGFGGYWRGGWS